MWQRRGRLQNGELHTREVQLGHSNSTWKKVLSDPRRGGPGKGRGADPCACPRAESLQPVQAEGQLPVPVPAGLRAQGRVRSTSSRTYTDSPFSILAVEGHRDFVLVPSPLIKGVTRVEGWAVQMQANSRLCVAYVLHTVQANGVYTSKGTKWEDVLAGRSNEFSIVWKKCFLNCNSWALLWATSNSVQGIWLLFSSTDS